MLYIPHKVVRGLHLSSLKKSNIFFFDAVRYTQKPSAGGIERILENTAIFFPGKKRVLKRYINNPDDPFEGYGFLREDGLEIQLIEGKQIGEYLIIADPSDELTISSIKQDLVDWLNKL